MMRLLKTTTVAVPLALLALSSFPLPGDDHDKKTDVTIEQPVQVPGGVVLQPGTYMFILENSASSRHIVEIKSEDGSQLYAMIFTTRAKRVDRTGKTVLTFYEMPAGQPPALRQWFWPGDQDGQEFLYPHSEAANIDHSANQKVPEVTDQEYNSLVDQGFSTRYPANAGTGSTSILNSNDQPSTPSQSVHVPDPGSESQR